MPPHRCSQGIIKKESTHAPQIRYLALVIVRPGELHLVAGLEQKACLLGTGAACNRVQRFVGQLLRGGGQFLFVFHGVVSFPDRSICIYAPNDRMLQVLKKFSHRRHLRLRVSPAVLCGAPGGQPVAEPVQRPNRQHRQRRAQHCAEQHIGGEVHKQIHSAEANQRRHRQQHRAGLFEVHPHRSCRREGPCGVGGGAGVAGGALDEQLYRLVQMAGPGPGNQVLETVLPHQKYQPVGQQHRHTAAPGFGEQAQRHAHHQPDLAVAAHDVGQFQNQRVHHRAAQGLNSVQN